MDTRQTLKNKLYVLIKDRIAEIEKEMAETTSANLLRHQQKILDHNKMILINLLNQEPHYEQYH